MFSSKKGFAAVAKAKNELRTKQIYMTKELIKENKTSIFETFVYMQTFEFKEADARTAMFRCIDKNTKRIAYST